MQQNNKGQLDSFVRYCEAHPDGRFWQAFRNWSDYDFVLGWKADEFDFGKVKAIEGLEDTFYKD